MKDIFEIHAPGIDSEALVRELEERVRSRGYTDAELERIRDLSFTPISPAGGGGFDPAVTAELFERPVPPPDFKSRKFRYLKGPLRWLAVRIYKLLAQVHDKLTENKTRAFYNVVHELIAVNHRHEKLRANFDLVLLENLRLRAKLRETLEGEKGSVTDGELRRDLRKTAWQPEAGSRDAKMRAALLGIISNSSANRRGPVLVLDGEDAEWARELGGMGFRDVLMNAPDDARFQLLEQAGAGPVFPGDADLCLAEQANDSVGLIIIPGLERVSGTAPLIPELIRAKLAPGGFLVLGRQKPGENSAFRPVARYETDLPALKQELTRGGLMEPVIEPGEAASAGQFTALLRKSETSPGGPAAEATRAAEKTT